MNSTSNPSFGLRADNIVINKSGCLFVEAMYSRVVDLRISTAEVAARIHPSRWLAYESIVRNESPMITLGEDFPDLPAGTPLAVLPDVEFHVSGPDGETVVHHFADILHYRQLIETGTSDLVRATIALAGFEPGAEPILREMQDGNLLIVFAFLPPLILDKDPEKANRFDMDTFVAEIKKQISKTVIWDDREVFVIQHPRRNTIEKIRKFVQGYWVTGE